MSCKIRLALYRMNTSSERDGKSFVGSWYFNSFDEAANFGRVLWGGTRDMLLHSDKYIFEINMMPPRHNATESGRGSDFEEI